MEVVSNNDGILENKEQEAVSQFIYQLSLENAFGDGIIVSEEEATKFLMARKFDVGRAISLYHANRMLRGRFELEDLNPYVEPLASELMSGKFTILRGRGFDGSTVCLFHAKKHFPKYVDHVTVLRSLVFQLDHVMRYRDTQRNGLSFIYNMTSSGYQNFDFDLAMKVLHLLKGGYPARLKNVFIISAPIWFRASLAVLSSFLKDKIRDRVEVVKNFSDLHTRVPPDVLPPEVSGTCNHRHDEWLQECIDNSRLDGDVIVLNTEYREGTDVNGSDRLIYNDNAIREDGFSVDNHDHDLSKDNTSHSGVETNVISDDKMASEVNGDMSQRNELTNPPLPPRRSPTPTLPPQKPLPPSPPPRDDFKQDEMNLEERQPLTFVELLHYLKKKGKNGLYSEYEEIRSLPPSGTFKSTLLNTNLPKNRYNNILAFEETRVRLQELEDDPSSDYINGNYVNGFNTPNKFICTQGPLPETFNDFWRMIWEQNVIVIVMITRCFERGRLKCGQYWPEHQDETIDYGDIRVVKVAVDVQNDFTSTFLDIYHTNLQLSRRVYHVQFTSWPDFGVLSTSYPIIEVIELIEQYQKDRISEIKSEAKILTETSLEMSGEYSTLLDEESGSSTLLRVQSDLDQRSGEYINPYLGTSNSKDKLVVNGRGNAINSELSLEEGFGSNLDFESEISIPPIVIHCSAGVGRTGTFCCLSNSIEQLNLAGTVDVFSMVKEIRDQRAFSVQTPEQYQFCYTGIVEYVIRQKYLAGDQEYQELQTFLSEFLRGEQATDSDE